MNPSPLLGPVALLKSGWKLFRAHWAVLAPIVILPSVIGYIGTLISSAHEPALTVVGAIISIAAAVFSFAAAPAAIQAIHRFYTEDSPVISLKQQYKVGFGYFWSFLLIALIYGLAFLGSFFLFVIPAIIVGVYVSFYIYALVVDGKKGFSALTESYSIVHGRWWKVFGRSLFLGLVMVIAWLILLGLAFLLATISGADVSSFMATARSVSAHASVSPGASFISFIVNVIGTGILVPIALGYTYRMYVSFKETREPDVSTVAFKRWLIAFMIIGPIGLVLFVGSAVALVGLDAARHAADVRQAMLMTNATTTTSLSSTTPNTY